jgi:hypothetical protein
MASIPHLRKLLPHIALKNKVWTRIFEQFIVNAKM